jgi:hypothetical protein
MSQAVDVKKRTRRKKTEITRGDILTHITSDDNVQIELEDTPVIHIGETKKRGRKPKGGKLLPKILNMVDESIPVQNVILHLRCSIKDIIDNDCLTDPLSYNNEVPPDILTYTEENSGFTKYTSDDEKKYAYTDQSKGIEQYVCNSCKHNERHETNEIDDNLINQKLKKIKLDLYKNNLSDKQSACFWCTYEFDNPPCYIPKYEMDGEMCAYGSFCRPECAVAFLMKESMDDSTKFERYQFLNQIYGKVYNFKHNIKPAPNPYYLLEKFYGNLSIQEYRKLLNSEHMLSVIEKPLTRILPELHEDNDEYSSSIYGKSDTYSSQTTGGYKVKRKSEKLAGPTNSDIMRENFGFVV